MSIETAQYDLVYGKLLKLGMNIDKAKSLSKILINISNDINMDINTLLKHVTKNGIKFDNEVYTQLNKKRTNSSQLGYLDRTDIPAFILRQAIVNI